MTVLCYLLAGSLKGAAATALVSWIDGRSGYGMRAIWRRTWWLLVPAAFLLPVIRLPVLPAVPEALASGTMGNIVSSFSKIPNEDFVRSSSSGHSSFSFWIISIWLTGVAASLIPIFISTWRAHRTWCQSRLCTDGDLLNLLEDCKEHANVTIPIGLVVSDSIPVPVLFGWLRPRLLLPRSVAAESSRLELKVVLLHELAHLKALDIPTNWLFVLVRAVYWFNPFAYFAASGWSRFREEAADETAISWLGDESHQNYGATLLKIVGQCSGRAAPMGALAIGESLTNLKRRVSMIRNYPSKSPRALMAIMVLLAMTATLTFAPTSAAEDDPAQAKVEAASAMQTWLTEMDNGDYAQSWTDASTGFKNAVTSAQWVAVSNRVRAQLGKILNRKQVSSLYQTSVPTPGGKTLAGQFVIAQYDSSFENLQYAIETVTFEREANGDWKASGYYIKPKT